MTPKSNAQAKIYSGPATQRLRFAGHEGPQALFSGRILSFDDKAGLILARLMAEGKAAGRPRSALDMIIAAVAIAMDCLVVTNNEKDFVGIPFVNPMRGSE
jgi:predicted nucleic acid-binding protein